MKILSVPRLLRLVLLLLVSICLPAFADGDESIPGNPPKLHQDIITCEDGSRWYGFTFDARLGLGYSIETSTDLVNWDTVEAIPGAGQQAVVLMKAAPPLPSPAVPPSAPPAPHVHTTIAFMLMRPATTGGIVLSWNSLDDGHPLSWYFPDLSQSAAWNLMVGYSRRFGDYDFLICDPPIVMTPAAANPAVGPLDTAMLAAFETAFPDMDADAVASVARTWGQPETPAVPTERHFWRVRCNWSQDSDGDGTPDWQEFEQLFALAAGHNPIAGPDPDPFNPDTDGDGIPDGAARSSGGNGIPDTIAASTTDPLINWAKTPPYRYAAFNVNPFFVADVTPPIQVNDLGDVLFPNYIWSRGAVHKWTLAAPVTRASGLFIDDLGTVYADGNLALPGDDSNSPSSCLVTFDHDGGNARPITKELTDRSPSVIAYAAVPPLWPARDMCSNVSTTGTGASLFHDRAFLANSLEHMEIGGQWGLYPGNVAELTPNRWLLLDDSIVIRGAAVPEAGRVGFGPEGEPWGQLATETGPYFYAPTSPPAFTQPYERCTKLPSGRRIVMAPTLRPKILTSTGWQESTALSKPTVDVSATTGMAYLSDGTVWQNSEPLTGQQLFGEESAPGENYQYVDASPQGWLLSTVKINGGVSVPLLGMPIHVEGVDASVTPAVVGAGDVGVDDLSATAKPGKGSQRALWVMAPIGGTPTSLRFRSPATTDNFLKLACDTATFSNDTVNASDMQLTITGTGSVSKDSPLNLKLANVASSIRQPVMVKTMKHRTVKVTVHPIGYKDANGSLLSSPTYTPTKQALEAYLNKVYGNQTNTFFDVSYVAEKDIYFDVDSDLKTNVDSNQSLNELNAICVDSVGPSPAANIDVWLVSGTTLTAVGKEFFGWHIGGKGVGKVIIDGDMHNSGLPDPGQSILNVFAHEIGHVMIGDGHPDDGGGAAILKGTELSYPKRLMYSMQKATPGKQLVKAEWDNIESWLKNEENNQRL